MIKVLLILLLFGCVGLFSLAIINTVRLNLLKRKCKGKIYHTPKLSELHGKNFANYMDYLTRDL